MSKKSITVTANETGWYLIKTVCDEGLIVTNVKLEAGIPLELSFVNEMRRDEPGPVMDKPFTSRRRFNNNRIHERRPQHRNSR